MDACMSVCDCAGCGVGVGGVWVHITEADERERAHPCVCLFFCTSL